MGRGELWGTGPTPGAEGMGKVPLEGQQGPPSMGCTCPTKPRQRGRFGQGPGPKSPRVTLSPSLADHHERPVPDAEEDAAVPEGAQQGKAGERSEQGHWC